MLHPAPEAQRLRTTRTFLPLPPLSGTLVYAAVSLLSAAAAAVAALLLFTDDAPLIGATKQMFTAPAAVAPVPNATTAKPQAPSSPRSPP